MARRQQGRRVRMEAAARQLGIFERGTWGGPRPGAGRPRTGRTRVPHQARERFRKKPVHVTMRVRAGLPSLRRGRPRRALVQIFTLACMARGFRLTDWSIQNEHLHLICEARSEEHLSRRMQGLASRIAKRINHLLGRHGPVWAERYHSHVLETPREVRNAIVYVLQNGRHHPMGPGLGPVPDGSLDACSSALHFDGWKERIPRTPALGRRPVAAPATWLRGVGWKRHGLISVQEAPAPERGSRLRGAPRTGVDHAAS